MRIAAFSVSALLLLLGSCGSTTPKRDTEFAKPNSLVGEEIAQRIEQIPYQHRDELVRNLLWLQQTGEVAVDSLLAGLRHQEPKVRSSCAWVLGRIGDRRTIPMLKQAVRDPNETVRLEVARSLLVLGDLQQSPMLIEGLDSDRKEVRFLCHEALKAATGRDFGFDHLSDNAQQRATAVYSWRQWWADYAGDPQFAQSYRKHLTVGEPAAPGGETKAPGTIPAMPLEQRELPLQDVPPQDSTPRTQGQSGAGATATVPPRDGGN